ncbi:MAG: glycosyltransferase family 4 protein [Leptolyngbyaceae cyanobacterium SM1_1_3]|nr:glycosyltransferase family 4 protein [Leptolyngbyaceae cyanobacterium SM1_1_3]
MASLLLSDTFLPRIGGRENYYHHLFSNLPQEKTIVLTPDYQGNWSLHDANYPLPVYRVEKLSQLWHRWGRPGRWRWFKTLLPLIRQYQIDLVHCGLVLPDGLTGWWLKQTLGLPYIVYTHGKEILENQADAEKAQLMSIVLLAASRVVSNSYYTSDLVAQLGVPAARRVVIHPGIVPAQWQTAPNPMRTEQLREQHRISHCPVLLSVGRLIERKGHDMVIKALPDILQRHPETVYVIVGEGPACDLLVSLAENLGVSQAVRFVGEVKNEDLSAYYALADIFVMVSRQPLGSHEVEGFGIVYLEANACGLAVVAGRSGGVPDAVVDGETGLLVDPFSFQGVAEAIGRLLNDSALRQTLGQQGKNRAIADFDWVQASQRLQTEIEQVRAETAKASSNSAGLAHPTAPAAKVSF